MSVPDWYEFLLLGLAAWSTFQLLAYDDLLDRPRRWVLRLGKEWQGEGDPIPDDYRIKWALFLTCPYCAGFWIWVAWLVAWWVDAGIVLPAAALMGGRAMVVFGQKTLAKEEDKTPSPDAEALVEELHRIGTALKR